MLKNHRKKMLKTQISHFCCFFFYITQLYHVVLLIKWTQDYEPVKNHRIQSLVINKRVVRSFSPFLICISFGDARFGDARNPARSRARCLATVPAHRETRKLLLSAKQTGEILKWAKNALKSPMGSTDNAWIQSFMHVKAGEI